MTQSTGLSARGLSPGFHRAVHDQHVGDVRRGVPRDLHGQPGRVHDHARGVPRAERAGRPADSAPPVAQARAQVRHRALVAHRCHSRQVFPRTPRLYGSVSV